ncbi:MAG: hypothetical protein K2L13_01425 [Opitutales bacterium]|nr:hypothetical protein [Opitutales bacterium]
MQRVIQFLFFGILLTCGMLPVAALDDTTTHGIPFTNSYYYHFSRDQNLGALVKDFCSMQGINVVISPMVSDVVNGRFNKMDPAEFWNYITQAYGLSWFYDGKILYVYKNSELQTQIFRMDADGIGTMSNIIKHLGFSSSDFSFRSVPSANILIVTAPPKYLETINDLSVKFVTEKITDTTIVKTFPLQYAWAYDMSFTYKDGSITVPGVATLLQNIVTGSQSAYSISTMDVNLGGKTQNKREKLEGLVQSNNPHSSQNNASSSEDKGKDKQSSESSENVSSTSTLPGFITCDQRLNAVIIRDKHQNMQFYEDIIKQLDVPCDVIKIDVAIVDVTQTQGMDFGLSSLGISKGQSKTLNIGISGDSVSKSQKSDLQGAANIFGQMTGVLKRYTISSYLQVLEDHGNAKVVAKPSVLTLDNVGAIIEKEETMYSKVSGTYSEGLYDINATTKLQVVPHVIPHDHDKDGKRKLKMFVNVQDGSLSGNTQQGATPTCNSNSINTQAVLYEGQSLLIGGYFKEEKSKSASGVPFLQRIPLVGNLFKRTIDSSNVVERIYVISPNIVDIDEQDHKFDHFMTGGNLETKGVITQAAPAQRQPKKITLNFKKTQKKQKKADSNKD